MTWRPLKNKENQRHRVSQRIQTKIFTECASNDVETKNKTKTSY